MTAHTDSNIISGSNPGTVRGQYYPNHVAWQQTSSIWNLLDFLLIRNSVYSIKKYRIMN